MSVPIEIEDAELVINGKRVLDGVSLSVNPGEVLALLGPSGSGKTSIIRLILGFIAPGRGRVKLAGEVVSARGRILRLPEERGLAVVFQDLALWPHLTVKGNLSFGLEARNVPRREREERIDRALARVGLRGKANRYPGDLSGGERQRVAIARALVQEPRAVLLDEPLANLDVALKQELLAMFRDLLTETQATAIYVTHDLREASRMGDRLVILEGGRVTRSGTLEALMAEPGTDFVKALVEDFRGPGLR